MKLLKDFSKNNLIGSELTELGLKYKTDKAWHKKHTEIYSGIFDYFGVDKDSELNILEVGVAHGRSHLMWYDYFKNSNIIGIDIMRVDEYYMTDHPIYGSRLTPPDDKKWTLEYIKNILKKDDRLDLYHSCQTDKKVISQIIDKYEKFDIIIDDASHISDNTRQTFNLLFPALKSKGMYIIEDLENFGSKIQSEVRADVVNWEKNKEFSYLKNYEEISDVRLIHSKDFVDVNEDFVLGVIIKS